MTSPSASENMSALGGTRTPNLLIRRSGQLVQDRPSPVVGWADIPELSTCVGCCSAPWLQLGLNGADPRPPAFQAGHIPSWHKSSERYALSLVAAGSRWLLLLLSAAGPGPISEAARRCDRALPCPGPSPEPDCCRT